MEDWEFRLGKHQPSHHATLCRPQPTPSRHFQVLVLQHSAFKAGSDPWLPWGLFSACAIAESTLGWA